MSASNEKVSEFSLLEKKVLLFRLLQKMDSTVTIPLSFAQMRLWLLHQLEPESSKYYNVFAIQLAGVPNIAVLEKTLEEIARRHEILRTNYITIDDIPEQRIAPSRTFHIPLIDLSMLPEEQRIQEQERLLQLEARKSVDLAHDDLINAQVYRLSSTQHLLVFGMHHIIADEWSVSLFLRELNIIYRALVCGQNVPLSDLPLQYKDYALWQRQWLRSEAAARQLDYWRENLKDLPPVLELAPDKAASEETDFRAGREVLPLSRELSATLKQFCQQEGITLYMLLLAVFDLLLYRLTGQEDLVIGTPVAGRNRREIEDIIGFFVNTLVLRVDFSGSPTFRTVLTRVREVVLDAFSNQDVPFDRLVQQLHPDRYLTHNPFFSIMFNFLSGAHYEMTIGDLTLQDMRAITSEAKFSLTLYADEREEGIRLRFVYRKALFSSTMILHLLHQMLQLLQDCIAFPDQSVQHYSLVTPLARTLLPDPTHALNIQNYPLVPEVLARVAAWQPDAPAIEHSGQYWSFHMLLTAARRIGQELRLLGYEQNTVIAVTGDRSFGLIAALTGLLIGGYIMLPLSPEIPAERQRVMLREAQARCLINVQSAEGDLKDLALPVLEIEPQTGSVLTRLGGEETDEETWTIRPDDPAYIFFTSGTTGVPKGILGTHRGLAHFLTWQRETFKIDSADRGAQFTGLSFDVVLRDIFLPLTAGATLCLPPTEAMLPGHVTDWLCTRGITFLHIVPSLASAWLAAQTEPVTTAIRFVFFAGEPLPDALVARWRRFISRDAAIVNLYGPTETTLAKCYAIIPEPPYPGVQPVGRPLPETQALLRSAGGLLCGIGEPGEIVIRTPFMTRGYINAQEAQMARFISNPWSQATQDRCYLTGDYGRYLSDGTVQILGRMDHQVKIHGVRIEIQEIEAVLNSHPQVVESCVVAYAGKDGDMLLAAYVLPGVQAPTFDDLHRHLRKKLPGYMLPASLQIVDAFPLTANGKIDRSKLPPPEQQRAKPGRTIQRPRTLTEELLATLWATFLGIPQVGIYDNFFELGGHSLVAMQVVSRLRKALKITIPLRSLFEMPDIASLAAKLDQELAKRETALDGAISTDGEISSHSQFFPQSFAQQRLWFLEQLTPGTTAYTINYVIRIQGPLLPEILEQSLAEIIRRHEVLRTIFTTQEGVPVQQVKESMALTLARYELDGTSPTIEEELQRLIEQQASLPFDFEQGPLMRATLVKIAQDIHMFLFSVHHLIWDGWSNGVFHRELRLCYEAFAAGKLSPLTPLPVQYADYVAWQHKQVQNGSFIAQLDYWKARLAHCTQTMSLPTDFPRVSGKPVRGAYHSTVLPASLLQRTQTLREQENVTPSMLFLAVFQLLLALYTGEDDIMLGMPVAGRTLEEFHLLIGMFVNTLTIRTSLSGIATFRSLLQRVRDSMLEALMNQDVPFEMVVDAVNPRRSPYSSPLFQIMFIYYSNPRLVTTFAGLELRQVTAQNETAKYDLTMKVSERREDLLLTIEYNAELFHTERIAGMIRHFHALLEQVIQAPDAPFQELAASLFTEQYGMLSHDRMKLSYPEKSLQRLFAERVAAQPESIAVHWKDQQLTYAVLDRLSTLVARRLRDQGITLERRVGVFLERSLDTLIALLGILKAGGIYVPLDPSYPSAYLDHILEDSQPDVIISRSPWRAWVEQRNKRVLDITELDTEGDITPLPDSPELLDSLCFIMYTSGSTGKPKGVAVPQRQMLHRFAWMWRDLPFQEHEVMCQRSPISTTPSFWEWLGGILCGIPLVIIPGEVINDLHTFTDMLDAYAVTRIVIVPSLLQTLLDGISDLQTRLRHLKLWSVGGEAFSIELLAECRRKLPGARVLNQYGCSEMNDICWMDTSQLAESAPCVYAGKPISNTEVVILDRYLRPVSPGIVGDIYVSNPAPARGYFNQPALTAERFLPHPFSQEPGRRLYATGDRGRWNFDGYLEYMGRSDRQRKIRGLRVELGQIERLLMRHPDIKQAAVMSRDDMVSPGVVAYIVFHQLVSAPSQRELQAYLIEQLPDFMLPTAFVALEHLPLTPNGKIDRQALTAFPINDVLTEEEIEPRTPLEQEIFRIWGDLLKRERMSITSDFFALGGDSLMAMLMLARLRNRVNVSITLQDFLAAPTIAGLAEAIIKVILNTTSSEKLVQSLHDSHA